MLLRLLEEEAEVADKSDEVDKGEDCNEDDLLGLLRRPNIGEMSGA